MQYYKYLYVGKNLTDKKEQILAKLDENKLMLNTYVIALAKGEQNHLEFFNTALLKQKVFSKVDLFVVGIADGYEESLEIVEAITKEVYDKTRGADIRSYILKKEMDN